VLHYRQHDDPQSSHQQIARLVRRLWRTPVLDVGAAQGFMGQLFHESGLDLDAVEPHPVWAEHAAQYYRHVWSKPIEDAPLPAATYRVVICADVLEHTADPVGVLAQLRRAATPDAVFIISLPNVAHIAVRLLLLLGQFPRMERGILDRTHLHFYTRRTAHEMLREAGLVPVRTRPTPFPLEELWRAGHGTLGFRALMGLQRAALLVAPTLFAWQWIVVAQQKPDDNRIESTSPSHA
jgi:SAM-dependent methyltransferase